MVYHLFDAADFRFVLKPLRAAPNPGIVRGFVLHFLKIFPPLRIVPIVIGVKSNVRTIFEIVVLALSYSAVVADSYIHGGHTGHNPDGRDLLTDMFRERTEIFAVDSVPSRLVEIERIDRTVVDIRL